MAEPLVKTAPTERQAAGRARSRHRWLVGIGLVVLSALLSWGILYIVVGSAIGQPSPIRATSAPDRAARARVHGDPQVTALSADQVEVVWQVENTGPAEWKPQDYRFVPLTNGAPVISLPEAVVPHAVAEVRKVIPTAVVSQAGQWRLDGPYGPVPGGNLTLAGAAVQPVSE